VRLDQRVGRHHHHAHRQWLIVLIIPEKVIILATPRTGSRALEAAFSKGVKTKEHHVHPEDIAAEAEKLVPGSSKLPKYTICRNPYLQTLSWYWHAVARHEDPSTNGLLKFIKDQHISWYFDQRLNPYHVVADKILPYDQDARATALAIYRATGAPVKKQVPLIGQSVGLQTTLLSDKAVLKAIEKRFPDDIELYSEVLRTVYD
jgi:hypothetical protein